jgi:hypothetical protein
MNTDQDLIHYRIDAGLIRSMNSRKTWAGHPHDSALAAPFDGAYTLT